MAKKAKKEELTEQEIVELNAAAEAAEAEKAAAKQKEKSLAAHSKIVEEICALAHKVKTFLETEQEENSEYLRTIQYKHARKMYARLRGAAMIAGERVGRVGDKVAEGTGGMEYQKRRKAAIEQRKIAGKVNKPAGGRKAVLADSEGED